LGACVIEKHFTLDKSKIGMDNQMATEPDEFKKMIECCTNVTVALGSEKRIVSEKEKEMLLKMRRSVVAKHDLEEGKILDKSDFDYKRPGTGISPADVARLVGKKLRKNIKADYQICREDVE
jgi:N-acetylneuraminate synthase